MPYVNPQCWHFARRSKKKGLGSAGRPHCGQGSLESHSQISRQGTNHARSRPTTGEDGSRPVMKRQPATKGTPTGIQPSSQTKKRFRRRIASSQNAPSSIGLNVRGEMRVRAETRQSVTVTRKNVAGMEVMSLRELLFCVLNRSSSCLCRSATRPLLSAASKAFMVGP